MQHIKEKFRFFGDRSDCNHHTIIITAYSQLNTETNELSVSYSFCSKRDKYNKEFGKKIAVQRFIQRPCFIFAFDHPPSFIEIDKIIRENIAKSRFSPQTQIQI